jgi:hypothetical protein
MPLGLKHWKSIISAPRLLLRVPRGSRDNWLISKYKFKRSIFFGVFAELRKAIINFVMSVCPSACLSFRMEQQGSHWTDFHEIWYLSVFRKYVENIQISLKKDKNNRYFIWRPMCIYDNISLIEFFSEWEIFPKKLVQKIKTHFMLHNIFFEKVTFMG